MENCSYTDIIECGNFTKDTNIADLKVECSREGKCDLNAATLNTDNVTYNFVYNLAISWNGSALNESCVFFACYIDSNSTVNDTRTCELHEICNAACDAENDSSDGMQSFSASWQ